MKISMLMLPNCVVMLRQIYVVTNGSLDNVDVFLKYFRNKYKFIVYGHISQTQKYEEMYLGLTA